MQQELADFLMYCRLERRFAALTCKAYERDVRACVAFLERRGVRSLADVRTTDLRAFLADESHRRPAPSSPARTVAALKENACRYGSSRVHISIDRERTAVVYKVEDDGPGVIEAEQERIFEPGVRGRARDGDDGVGAGLGLLLARRLAQSVDGEVDVEAAESGARFVVRLPTG